jgi:hypothetical protein
MIMRSITHLAGGAGALVLAGILATAAHAQAFGSISRDLATEAPAVTQAAKRPAGARNGHTAAPQEKLAPFTYGMREPHEVPFGSSAWWRQMQSTGHIR